MKKIVCELCGSTDLIKRDGVWVCESCGGKFTLEEARKMMVDGVVDIKGKVSIDDTDRLRNYFVQAETMLEAEDTDKALEYCDKILENNVGYEKAWFLKGKISFEKDYRAAMTFFKKAVDYAAQKSDENKNAMINDIDEFVASHCKSICQKYNVLGFVDYICSKVFADRKKYAGSKGSVNPEIQKYFEDYFKDNFELVNYFYATSEYNGYENDDYMQKLLTVVSDLNNAGYINKASGAYISNKFCDLIQENLQKTEENYIESRSKNRSRVPEWIRDGYFKVVNNCFALYHLAVDVNKDLAGNIVQTFPVFERRIGFYKNISWAEGDSSYSFKDEYKQELDEKIDCLRKLVCMTEEPEVEAEKEENSEEHKYTCGKCGHVFAIDAQKNIYDDEKESIICPQCGHINKTKSVSAVQDETLPEKEAEGQEEEYKDKISLQTMLWIAFIIAEFVCFTLDGGFSLLSQQNNVAVLASSSVPSLAQTTSSFYTPSSEPARIYIEPRFTSGVNKKVYAEDEKIQADFTWKQEDSNCEKLEKAVDTALEQGGFKKISGNCFSASIKSEVYYSVVINPKSAGKQLLPIVRVDNLIASSQEFFVESSEKLIEAVKSIDFTQIDKLLPPGKGLEQYTIDGQNAAFYLLKKEPKQTEKTLKYIKNINVFDEKNGTSLLISAAVNNNIKLLDFLLERGVDVNYLDKKGRTAIMYAAIKNNISVIKKLNEKGADLFKTRDGKWTAYKYAKEYGNNEAAKLVYKDFDEILYFDDFDNDYSKNLKKKFEKVKQNYPTFKVKYLKVIDLLEYFGEEPGGETPVIVVQNSKTGKGWRQEGWNGTAEAFSTLMTKQ